MNLHVFGAQGIGKTNLTKLLAENLIGSKFDMNRFDMSELKYIVQLN